MASLPPCAVDLAAFRRHITFQVRARLTSEIRARSANIARRREALAKSGIETLDRELEIRRMAWSHTRMAEEKIGLEKCQDDLRRLPAAGSEVNRRRPKRSSASTKTSCARTRSGTPYSPHSSTQRQKFPLCAGRTPDPSTREKQTGWTSESGLSRHVRTESHKWPSANNRRGCGLSPHEHGHCQTGPCPYPTGNQLHQRNGRGAPRPDL